VSVFVIFLGPGAGSRMAGGRGHHARNRRRHNRHPGHRPARGRDHLGPLGSRPPHRLAPAGCRAFLQRAVRSLAGEAGIRQIIDVGTGLPAAGNVHEVAAQIAPVTRVAYVDNDPIVHVHADAMLTGSGATSIVLADLRDPEVILAHPKVRALIDFAQPVALLLVAILPFITDRGPGPHPGRLPGRAARGQLPGPVARHRGLPPGGGPAGGRRVRPGHIPGDPAHPCADRRVLRRLAPGQARPGPGAAMEAGRQTAPAAGTRPGLGLRRRCPQEPMTAERAGHRPHQDSSGRTNHGSRPGDPFAHPSEGARQVRTVSLGCRKDRAARR